MLAKLISEDLICESNQSDTKEVFFEVACKHLQEKGYIKDTFYKAITKREEDYPTGLKLENITIAIPHTDSEHVIEPFVYFNKMENKIDFIQMGTDDESVFPEIIMVLGIKDPSEQLELLPTILNVFQDESFVQKLKEADSKVEIFDLIKGE